MHRVVDISPLGLAAPSSVLPLPTASALSPNPLQGVNS